MTRIDPAELSALRLIASAAAAFVDAVDTDEQIERVYREVPDEWQSLADTVILLRQTAKLPKLKSAPEKSI